MGFRYRMAFWYKIKNWEFWPWQIIYFPVILKPEYGERGWMVEKIEDSYELEKYVHRIKVNFLLQEYIDWPKEWAHWKKYRHSLRQRV